MTKKSFLVYFDWEEPIQELSNEELGELFRAVFIYAKYGELIDFEHRSLKLVFGFIKSAIDRDKAAYAEKCRINSENASKGRKNNKDSSDNNSKIKKTTAVGANMSYDQLISTLSPNE